MKKKYYFLLIIIFFGIFLFLFFSPKKTNLSPVGFKVIEYSLEGKTQKFLIADTPEKWERGLMYYRNLNDVEGMIFIFPDKDRRTFWNKNTYLDLDIYWLNDDKIVGKVFLPSIEKSKDLITVKSPEDVNKVIEIVRN